MGFDEVVGIPIDIVRGTSEFKRWSIEANATGICLILEFFCWRTQSSFSFLSSFPTLSSL